MEKSFYTIFKTFFKVGMLLLGGGYVILPLLQNELVEKKGWISSDELCEFYALSTGLPGIIAANTAIFTGRKLMGTKGAIAAILGVTLPAFVAIILIASIVKEIVGFKFVSNIFWGVTIGVITLLFLAVKEMWSKCIIDKFSLFVYLTCLILALWGKLSPIYIVVLALIIGIMKQKLKGKYNV